METFSTLLALCARNSPVNSPHKGQWRGALMFSLICTWINGWVNNGEAGDLRRHRAHYDVIVMCILITENRTLQEQCALADTTNSNDRMKICGLKYIDGLMKERRNPKCLSNGVTFCCINPSILCCLLEWIYTKLHFCKMLKDISLSKCKHISYNS